VGDPDSPRMQGGQVHPSSLFMGGMGGHLAVSTQLVVEAFVQPLCCRKAPQSHHTTPTSLQA